MFSQSTDIDGFYSNIIAGSPIKDFFEAEKRVAAIQQVPESWGLEIKTAGDAIANIEEEANEILIKLATVNNRADSLDIYWQSQAVRNRLATPMAVVLEKQYRMNAHRQERALAALPMVLSLPAGDILQRNRKDMLQVYLEITSTGATKLSQSQFAAVSAVAHQCPLAGGSAVYKARSLYQINEQKNFDDISLCRSGGERTDQDSKTYTNEVKLRPNPNSGRFQLYLSGISTEQRIQVRIIDLFGRVVQESSFPSRQVFLSFPFNQSQAWRVGDAKVIWGDLARRKI